VFEDHLKTKQKAPKHKARESLRNLIKSNFNTKPLLCTGTMIPGNIEREEDEKAEQQTTGSRE
jgi:hypothetical protein